MPAAAANYHRSVGVWEDHPSGTLSPTRPTGKGRHSSYIPATTLSPTRNKGDSNSNGRSSRQQNGRVASATRIGKEHCQPTAALSSDAEGRRRSKSRSRSKSRASRSKSRTSRSKSRAAASRSKSRTSSRRHTETQAMLLQQAQGESLLETLTQALAQSSQAQSQNFPAEKRSKKKQMNKSYTQDDFVFQMLAKSSDATGSSSKKKVAATQGNSTNINLVATAATAATTTKSLKRRESAPICTRRQPTSESAGKEENNNMKSKQRGTTTTNTSRRNTTLCTREKNQGQPSTTTTANTATTAATATTTTTSTGTTMEEEVMGILFPKKPLPRRTKSIEKPKRSNRGSEINTLLMSSSKKGPSIRRTRSYESITTDESTAANNINHTKTKGSFDVDHGSNSKNNNYGRRSSSMVVVDERGLPMSSIGCPPVASLQRARSPNNMEETESFDAVFAQKLQHEEYMRSSSRARGKEKRKSPTIQTNCHGDGDDDDNEEDDNRKMPATEDRNRRATRSGKTPSRRRSLKETTVAETQMAPLNPEEALVEVERRRQEDQKAYLEKAKAFVQVLGDKTTQQQLSSSLGSIFCPVLGDNELPDVISSLYYTQRIFQQQNKPGTVDVAYHFCRGGNIRKIRQQPGLWSKIQKSGVGKSEDGDGIYTFSNPPTATTKPGSNVVDDVWMIVARIKGNEALVGSPGASCRTWGDRVDALVGVDAAGGTEHDMVVLKGAMQIVPLFYYPCSILSEQNTADHAGILRQIQLVQESLQHLLDTCFNGVSKDKRVASSNVVPPCEKQRSIPSPPPPKAVGQTQQQEKGYGHGKKHLVDTQKDAVKMSHEVQAVVDEHAALAVAAFEFCHPHQPFTVEMAVSIDEMTELVNNMAAQARKFEDQRKSPYVEIGYHYCRAPTLKKMQQKKGFWSSIQSRGFNKSEDGDGIYTFNNPLSRSRTRGGGDLQSLSNYDDVWLMVARIQGRRESSRAPSNPAGDGADRRWQDDIDAIVVGGRQSDDVVVLRTSAQMFPLLQFRAADLHSSSNNNTDQMVQDLQLLHSNLQGILDDFFNGKATNGKITSHEIPGIPFPVRQDELLEYVAPDMLDAMKSIHSTEQQIYRPLSNKKPRKDDCSICLDSLRRSSAANPVVRLRNCGHEFHLCCLQDTLQHFELCPICNQPVTPPQPKSCLQGLSPSGTMVCSTSAHIFCQGAWAPRGSLVVRYFLPGGTQKVYHESPGTSYPSSNFNAVLPYNHQGICLLRRLQYAFLYGLPFSIEKTEHHGENAKDVTVWASLPHKTRHSSIGEIGSALGDSFPDPSYFDRCNKELDRCGVPPFEECARFVEEARQYLQKAGGKAPCPSRNRQAASLSSTESGACIKLLKGLQYHQHGWIFRKALPVLDGKIETPMDLSLIEDKLTQHKYASIEEFSRDVALVFDNAMTYHSKENPVHFMAKQLTQKFKKDFKDMLGDG